tara:strand:+ start:332 stop:1072 length:741 start_codon:yes stop_codon:yes gene_type:complete
MTVLLDLLILAHVATGFIGLGAFWVPVFARKGGPAHKRFGAIYTYCAYVVTLSAVTASVGRFVEYRADGLTVGEEPALYGFALFLGYLGVATFASVRQSIRAVETRHDPAALRTPFHLGLAYASVGGSLGVIGYALVFESSASPILFALSPIGIFTGLRMINLMRHPGTEHMGWFYSHMGSMLGGGIAFHTAFAVFGAQRLWDYSLSGGLAVVPWILPTLIGIPGIILGRRYYQKKFNRPAQVATA